MSDDGTIHLDLHDDVAVLTIDRPRRRNALHGPLWAELPRRVEQARVAKPRALIVTGAGPHFCAGMDLKPDNPLLPRILPAVMEGDADTARALIRELKAGMRGLLDFPAPTFAAVEGVAVGGGYEVALHCDVIVAARTARVGLPEVRVGMVPDVGGTTLLTRRVGPGRAVLAIATGRMFDAEAAFELGMVDMLCDTGAALETARGLAAEVARGGPTSVQSVLQTIRALPGLELDACLDRETEAGVAALVSGEAREGTLSFMEQRDPDWSEYK